MMSAASSPLELDTLNDTFRAALAEGRLLFQACACGQRWLPARVTCSACLSSNWKWETAQGGGRLKSWVVYHVAFHEAFRDRLPYNVAIVQLDEGPSLITNILADNALLQAEARVRFVASLDGERTLAKFALIGEEQPK
jgi:uncharacterized OB-fold protein